MAEFKRGILTSSGAELLAQAQTGDVTIEFTGFQIGDGDWDDETSDETLAALTELKSKQCEYEDILAEYTDDATVELTLVASNVNNTNSGFYITEVGIFAQAAGTSSPILYAVYIAESDKADWFPAYNSVTPSSITYTCPITVANASEVTVSTTAGLVTTEVLEKVRKNLDSAKVDIDGGELANTIATYDDSGEVDGITSFTEFLSSLVSGLSIAKFFRNLKAGLQFVLHVGSIVDDCVTDNPELPLSAAQGKALMDLYTELNGDLTNGTVTKVGTSTVGGTAKPIYLSSGTPTALTGTAGGTAKPVYLNAGTIQACSGSVGSGTKPVYMSSGTVTASSSTVGASDKPIWLNGGTLTASSATIGTYSVPMWISSGVFKSSAWGYIVGFVSVTTTAANTVTSSTVTFDDPPFTQTPAIILSINGNGSYDNFAFRSDASASGFTVNVRTNYSGTTTLSVAWIAMGYVL